MNFQKIPPVQTSETFLELAFRRARQKGKSKTLKGNWLQIIRKKECLKLDVVRDSIVPRLEKIVGIFPQLNELSKFYQKLIKLTLDVDNFKKSLGSVNQSTKRIKTLHKRYIKRINVEKDRTRIKGLTKEFYGRVSSVLKRLDNSFQYLEKSRKIMKTYPDVKDMPTVCIYGFPNVGKTTLLNKLTGTKAKIAEYAFTTVGINAGYLTVKDKKVQVLDVPGTLARKDKMNNVELQAELVRKELADLIIYVFDLTENCGYSIEQQNKLLKKLGEKKPVLIYLSKVDLLDAKTIVNFPYKQYPFEDLKREIKIIL